MANNSLTMQAQSSHGALAAVTSLRTRGALQMAGEGVIAMDLMVLLHAHAYSASFLLAACQSE